MKKGSLIRLALAVGLVVPAALAASPHDAGACGGAVRQVVDPKTQQVARAERSLSEGQYAQAATAAVQAFPALQIIKAGTNPLSDRSLRILALAAVRTDGALTAGAMKGDTAARRAANLQWSIATLRDLNARRNNNPTFQSDLGEALSKVPKHHAEALKILGELAGKDLLTSAEGYAALAKLRAASGDAAGRDAAVKRCEGMAKVAKICQTGPVDSNSRS